MLKVKITWPCKFTSAVSFFRRHFLLVLFSICINTGFSQKLIFHSASDDSPLAYTTVTNIVHPFMASADKDGIVIVKANIGDTLLITNIGHRSVKIIYDGSKTKTVVLNELPNTMTEVVVRNCKKYKKLKYGNAKEDSKIKMPDGTFSSYGGVEWTKGAYSHPGVAVLLNPGQGSAILKEFSFWLAKQFRAPENSIYTPMLVSFWDVSDSSHLPGTPISNASIVYWPKKNGKQTLKLDSLNIHIQQSGVYVFFQYVMSPEYEWEQKTKWKMNENDEGRDTIITHYGGTLGGVYSKGFDIVFYNSLKDVWFVPSGQPVPADKLHGTIKCDAIFKYCE